MISVQLLRHLREKDPRAIHVRPEFVQLEGEQLRLGERCMELSSVGYVTGCQIGEIRDVPLDSPTPGSNNSFYRRSWQCSNDRQ